MTYENTQPRPGHLHSVSSNPGKGGGSDDGQDGGLAGSGHEVLSDHYPHAVSVNDAAPGSDTSPEGQLLRGYVHNQENASASLKDTSAGRVRSI